MNAIATRMYGANSVQIEATAKRQLKKITDWGYVVYLYVWQKHSTFSHDAGLLGAPTGFDFRSEFRLNAGAGFVMPILGSMMTMPGLPKHRSKRYGYGRGRESEGRLREHRCAYQADREPLRLRIESEDDLWVLARLLHQVDVGDAWERRDTTTAESGLRAKAAERKKMWIELRVQTTEYQSYSDTLRCMELSSRHQ